MPRFSAKVRRALLHGLTVFVVGLTMGGAACLALAGLRSAVSRSTLCVAFVVSFSVAILEARKIIRN